MKEIECNEVILELTENFKETIPSEEVGLAEQFKNYLYCTERSIKNSKSKFVAKDSKSIKEVLEQIANELAQEDLQTKKKKIMYDENYDKISSTSNEIFRLAEDKLNGKKLKVDFNLSEKIDEILNLLKNVQSYNKQDGEILVSEAILDLNYIFEQVPDVCSIRLGRLKRSKETAKINSKEEER